MINFRTNIQIQVSTQTGLRHRLSEIRRALTLIVQNHAREIISWTILHVNNNELRCMVILCGRVNWMILEKVNKTFNYLCACVAANWLQSRVHISSQPQPRCTINPRQICHRSRRRTHTHSRTVHTSRTQIFNCFDKFILVPQNDLPCTWFTSCLARTFVIEPNCSPSFLLPILNLRIYPQSSTQS